jgi:uncharacterized protein (DUF1697 family)
MAELRGLFHELGHSKVSTFIQSGNVIFDAESPPEARELEEAISNRFLMAIPVVLRSMVELRRVVGANPFEGVDPDWVHVGFMAAEPPGDAQLDLHADRYLPERFELVGTELYLCLPDGMGRAKLPQLLDRRLKTPTTYRNWRTVTKLVELAAG